MCTGALGWFAGVPFTLPTPRLEAGGNRSHIGANQHGLVTYVAKKGVAWCGTKRCCMSTGPNTQHRTPEAGAGGVACIGREGISRLLQAAPSSQRTASACTTPRLEMEGGAGHLRLAWCAWHGVDKFPREIPPLSSSLEGRTTRANPSSPVKEAGRAAKQSTDTACTITITKAPL